MSITLSQPKCFWHGLMPVKPKLPNGWEYYEDANNWLLAKSPDGKWWFAGSSALIRCKWAGLWDVLRTSLNYFRRHRKAFRVGEIFAGKERKELHPAIILNSELQAAMNDASDRGHEAYLRRDMKTWRHWLCEWDRLLGIFIDSYEAIHHGR